MGLLRLILRAVSAAGSFVLFGYALIACTASFIGAGVDASDQDVGTVFLLGFGSFALAFVFGYYALTGRLPGRSA